MQPLKNKKAAFLSEMPHFFEWARLLGIVLRTEEKIKSCAKRGARSKNSCFSEKFRFLRRRPAIFSNLLVFQRSDAIHAPRRYQNSFLQDNFLAPRVCFYNPARR